MSEKSLHYEYPKDVTEYIGKELKRGNDFIVFDAGKDWVAKRPNFENISPKIQRELSQTEYYETLVTDTKKLTAIFGDNYEPAIFCPATDSRNFVLLQKRFKPEQFVAHQLLKRQLKGMEIDQYIEENREQFSSIVFAAKKALIEFGYPVDIQPANLVTEDNKIIFIETDCPTYRAHNLFRFKDKAKKELERLELYEKLLNLTEDEKRKLNSKYGIENDKFEDARNKVLESVG